MKDINWGKLCKIDIIIFGLMKKKIRLLKKDFLVKSKIDKI